jgi:hypothetical protein
MPITENPPPDHSAIGLSGCIFMFEDEVIRSCLRLEDYKIVRMNSNIMSQAIEDCFGVHSASQLSVQRGWSRRHPISRSG